MSSTASATASASTSAAGLVDSAANPAFKIVGICLAIGSGFFIGTSFVVKKKGLLRATAKYGNSAGEGHGYLKSWLWWTGLLMMAVGEILNFVAYAFTEAILVTPMGALSVVICAILSHFFLQETLTFFGWIGCILCIIGATILALNAPEQQSVTTINAFKHLFLSVGFLVWGSLLIVASLVLAFYVAPKWGRKNMMPYISICSLIGGISVSCTQGLGASIVTSIQGNNQVKNWYFWFLLGFVVITLLIEINYLNKALELFNTSMVVPVYFCYFTTATMITSFILYQGLKASAITLVTMVLGFLVICLGITLLQLSKVDPKQLGKLDRRSTMLMQAARNQTEDAEKGEVTAMEDPGIDALRGGFGAVGSIIRARSVSRRMSNASSLAGHQGGMRWAQHDNAANLSTHGLNELQRYQLSDNPMPHDALDQISLHSKSPLSPGLGPRGSFPFPLPSSSGSSSTPQRSKSHLKFEEADVVHQYGYQRDSDFQHYSRPHSQPRLASMGGSRQVSVDHPAYPILVEEPEPAEDDEAVGGGASSAPLQKMNPYDTKEDEDARHPQSARPRLQSSVSTTSTHSHVSKGPGLKDLFHFRSSGGHADDSHRGGEHRGTKDYPHLGKRDADQERIERRKLVQSGGTEEDEEEEGEGPSAGDISMEKEEVGPDMGGGGRRGPRGPRGRG